MTAITGRVVTQAEDQRATGTALVPATDDLAAFAAYVHANWRAMTPAQCYAAGQRIAQLREVCVVGFFGQRSELLEEAEWKSLPFMLRFFVLTDAGLSDPDGAMQRNWREYPQAERHAIRATLRAWARELGSLGSLTL